jgi:hypothetical protein
MPRTTDSGFDAAVVDRENHAVALIEVKAQPVGDQWMTILSGQVAKVGKEVDFVLAIDPKDILLYRWAEGALTGPIVHLDTAHVLQQYDQDFPDRRVFESYLLTLVEAWLRDLAYHWKSENPPGAEELQRAGLLGRLEGGTTQRLGA